MIGFSGKRILLAAAIIILLAIIGFIWWNFAAKRLTDLPSVPPATAPVVENKILEEVPLPSPAAEPAAESEVLLEAPLAASVAKKLEIPWALAFLPDGSIVFTERVGRVRFIDAQEGLLPEPLLTIDDVAHHGESGLLGIAVHPDFARNQFIYVYYTYQDGENLANRVVRFREQDRALLDGKIIIDGIPGANIHNGGRVKFGPEGLLYITTGDAAIPDSAQDKNSLAGKILRLKDDGTIPVDNPFPSSPVYSYGHRNPQGLAWDAQGRLWATEHGGRATDELNLIESGRNYGWPIIRGDEKNAGLENPVLQSGKETWAPSGAAFLNGSLFFTGLRGQSLYELAVENQPLTLRRHLNGNFGRLRDVVVGPDNFLYLLTSNRDGRGVPAADDDQIIRINPEKL